MIHILNHQSDEIVGWVSEVLDDVHSHALQNNEETYEFTIPVTERDSDKLTSRARLLIPSEDGDFREFVVDYTQERTVSMEKEVYAYGSFVDLQKLKVLEPQNLNGQTVRTAASTVLQGLPWQVGITDYSEVRSWIIDNHIDAYSALKDIASLFDLELRFRVTVDGDVVTGRYVDFIERQGLNRGKEIVFSKDLIGVTRRVLSERLVTALHCIGPEREDGTRLEVTVTDETAYQNWNWHGNHLVQVFEPQSNEKDMTIEQLTQIGQTELQKRITAAVEYEVDAVSLEHIFGYEHEITRLGDSARIKDEHFHPPMYLDSRIVYVERSVFDPSEKSFKLGEVIEYTEEEIMATWRDLQDRYAPKIIKSDTPPFGRANTIWIDTSQVPNVVNTWNGTTWVKATPTVAGEVGAETPEGAQDKADAAEAGAKTYADGIKTALDQDIAGINQDLSALDTYVDGSFKDGVVSEAEAKAIEKYLNALGAEKSDLDTRYTEVYGNASLTGTAKTNLLNAKNAYNTSHSNLVGSINTAIADGKATSTEKADVDTKFADYKTKLATLSQRFEQAIDVIAQAKATAAETAAKSHADSKANTAEANAKLYAQNASNITSGIIDVGAVPLRTAPSGARIVFDGTNGFVQYNAQGQAIVQLGLNGVNKFAGELQAATGTFNGSLNVTGTGGTVSIADGTIENTAGLEKLKIRSGYMTADYDSGARSATFTYSQVGVAWGLEYSRMDHEEVKFVNNSNGKGAGIEHDGSGNLQIMANGLENEVARFIPTGLSMTGTNIVSTADRAWIAPTLLNGVSNYDGGYQTVAYYKDALGFVHLRGYLTGSADGKHIFTLPTGYRPSALSTFTSWSNSSVGTSRISISTTGVVTATVSGNWLSLDGIYFLYGN